MKDIFMPLNDEEFERLDSFLLGRIDDDAEAEGKDEGVLDISELDGMFTAIVSGPVSVMPSHWLPAIWGDFEPVWETKREFEEIFSLMVRHMNSIAAILMEAPEDFEPIFLERTAEGKTYTIVDEWCEGYVRGMGLAAKEWGAAQKNLSRLLVPIMAFTEFMDWQGHDLSPDEMDILRNGIAPNVREIHAYWLKQRMEAGPAVIAGRHPESKVGRNDPCPCGSGKKYKKCCLIGKKIVPIH